MQQPAPVQSIAAVGDAIGARAAGHLDLVWRNLVNLPGVERNAGFMRVVTGEPHPFGNVAIVSDRDDLAISQAAIGPLLECGAPAAVLYPQGVSDVVAAAVNAQGFEGHGSMPAMAVDLTDMRTTTLPAGYTIARIGAGAAGRAWTETLAVGYGLPPSLAHLFSPDALGADMAPGATVQFFAVLRDGRTVSTSLLYLADGLAGIYCVATLEEERGKGLGAHATAEALRAAQRVGYSVGVLQSSVAGHSVYRGLGFADFAGVPMFVRVPA